jgi:hypothetical protein
MSRQLSLVFSLPVREGLMLDHPPHPAAHDRSFEAGCEVVALKESFGLSNGWR